MHVCDSSPSLLFHFRELNVEMAATALVAAALAGGGEESEEEEEDEEENEKGKMEKGNSYVQVLY